MNTLPIRIPPMYSLLFVFVALRMWTACVFSSDDQPALSLDADGQNWEAISLLGDTLYPPLIDAQTRHRHDSLLLVAFEDFFADSTNLDHILWLGRRLAYLHRYRDAVEVFTYGLRHHPESAALYRHRGHRYITLRRLDDAVRDLEKAAALAHGQPVTIEPDGIPNKLNIPLSNLHFNIYYHLGLARYLRGEYALADSAYAACMRYALNPDLVVATTDWWYLTRMRTGDTTTADQLLTDIHPDMEIIENDSYLKRLLLYAGKTTAAETDTSDALASSTWGYGVSCWHDFHGRPSEAAAMRRELLSSGYWPSFGVIAAESDSARLRPR